MSEQDDFKSPEEIQADLNSAKIRGFIANIAWQFIILTTVVYATYLNNWAADIALTGYGFLIGMSCAIFFLVAIKPIEKLAMTKSMRTSPLMRNTPTAKFLRVVGTMFSLVEIALLVSFDYPLLAALWAATEVLQYLAAYKLRIASMSPLSASQMVDAKYERDPTFAKDLEKDMRQYEREVKNIDDLIADLNSDDDITPNKYKEAVNALIDERDKLIDAMEARITKAALETIQDKMQDDENK